MPDLSPVFSHSIGPAEPGKTLIQREGRQYRPGEQTTGMTEFARFVLSTVI